MGPGAGGQQTATAVVSDIVSITNTKDVGFLQSCSCYRELGFYPAEDVESAFFIKTNVEDVSGVLAQHRLGVRGPRGVHRQHDPEGAGRRRRSWCSSPTRPRRRTSSPPSRR